MRLETDNYLVTTDGKQFILQMKYIIKDHRFLEDKTKIGETGLGEKCYYTSVPSLYSGLVKYSLLNDDSIQSFEEIISLMEETKKTLLGYVEKGSE